MSNRAKIAILIIAIIGLGLFVYYGIPAINGWMAEQAAERIDSFFESFSAYWETL